jgi:hypothetical protein
VNELKKEGKQLNNQLSNFKKQNAKVDRAIAAVIKKARYDARKAASFIYAIHYSCRIYSYCYTNCDISPQKAKEQIVLQ